MALLKDGIFIATEIGCETWRYYRVDYIDDNLRLIKYETPNRDTREIVDGKVFIPNRLNANYNITSKTDKEIVLTKIIAITPEIVTDVKDKVDKMKHAASNLPDSDSLLTEAYSTLADARDEAVSGRTKVGSVLANVAKGLIVLSEYAPKPTETTKSETVIKLCAVKNTCKNDNN